MRIHLVRHGSTELTERGIIQGRELDPPLSKRGREEMEELSRRCSPPTLRGKGVLVSSPLRRAVESAEILRLRLGVGPCCVEGGLSEIAWGKLSGEPVDGAAGEELRRIIRRWREGEVDLRTPAGESARDVAQRSYAAIAKVASRESPDDLWVVSHKGTLEILLSFLLERRPVPHESFSFEPASARVVHLPRGALRGEGF